MGCAAHIGDLAMLEFLYDNRSERIETTVMDQAASSGHLEILRFLHARQTDGCTEYAFSDAGANGHLPVAKWLHATYGFEVTRRVLAGAIKNGDLVCLRWLLTHWRGGAPDVVFQDLYPPLTMVQFLLEMGSVFSAESMDYAAYNGHLALLIKLHEFGATCSADAMEGAALNCHVDVVRWLFANRTEGCTEGPVEGFVTSWGSMMKFMANEVDPVDCTPLKMIEAAEGDDICVVEWLSSPSQWILSNEDQL